jgi:hypothetical protein
MSGTYKIGSRDPIFRQGSLVRDGPGELDHDVEVYDDGASQVDGVSKPDVSCKCLKIFKKKLLELIFLFQHNSVWLKCLGSLTTLTRLSLA